jgi:hypothetical protein
VVEVQQILRFLDSISPVSGFCVLTAKVCAVMTFTQQDGPK